MPAHPAFAQPLALLTHTTRAHRGLCRVRTASLSQPVRMRAGGTDPPEPEPSVPMGGAGSRGDDDPLTKEDPVETAPLVGGSVAKESVSPADFEDDIEAIMSMKPPMGDRVPNSRPASKRPVTSAGTAGVEDELVPDNDELPVVELAKEAARPLMGKDDKDAVSRKAPVEGKAAVEKKPSVERKAPAKKKSPMEDVPAAKSESRPDSKTKEVSGGSSSVQMTPEQIQKANAARAATAKAAEEKAAEQKERTKRILANAEKLIVKLGTKSKAFELGETARAKAEVFVDNTIKLSTSEKATQQDKLKSSAASAAKSVVATITKGWEDQVAPQIQERLPEDLAGISKKALASAAVGLFVAIALLPSLFSGGGEPAKKGPERKKLDADTAVLEKRLKRESSISTYGSASRSSVENNIFPPEEKPLPKKPAPAEVPRRAPVTEVVKPEPPKTTPATPVPPAAPPAPIVSEVAPPKPAPPPKPEPVKPVEVTPALVMSSVTKALGSDSVLISSASFDSLSAEPTVVLEVSRSFHRLPEAEQRLVAGKALKATRVFGYERISFVEQGTSVEVAHAGVDIDLEDETENLRAQLASMRKQSDRLAGQNAMQAAEIDALNSRLTEERDEFVGQRNDLENVVKNLQTENSGLLEDLAEAKTEISKMPDRLALEERTIEAETKSNKLLDTVEMLSNQLTKARDEEAIAKQSEASALAAAKEADNIKSESLASVAGRIARAQAEAQEKASEEIRIAQNEANLSVQRADQRVRDMEQVLEKSQNEASRTLQDTTQSFEKKLGEEQTARTKEVQTIQDKYEKLLDDVQRKAKADLDAFQKEADKKMQAAIKEAQATANVLIKERDQAVKETAKVESQGEKAAVKAEREKSGLRARIERLKAKLKGRELPAEQTGSNLNLDGAGNEQS